MFAVGLAAFVVGVGLLLVSLASALALSLEHLAGLALPGCGAGSPCAQAAASAWGKVPYVNWPVSHLGAAWFFALLAAWTWMRPAISTSVRWLVRLGVLASIAFTLVMLIGGYLCPYCLAVHAGNIAFWVLLESCARRSRKPPGAVSVGVSAVASGLGGERSAVRAVGGRPLAAGVAAFALATVVLAVIEYRVHRAAVAVAETQLERSTAAVIGAQESSPTGAEPTTQAAAQTAPAEGGNDGSTMEGFTGRYRLGPEEALLRFVLFVDYQCAFCKVIDEDLKALLAERNDLSMSVKFWPGEPECNPYTPNRHVGACLAARAAEAAGMLGGNDVFWQMHFWLFERSGRVTPTELREAAVRFGLDADEFERLMRSEETARRVAADVQEGFELGLRTTPMIFVNGVEFTGWNAPLALRRLVEKASSSNLRPATAQKDRPPPAVEAFIRDWRMEPPQRLLPVERAWPSGPADARLRIVVFGDYQQQNSVLADGIIRQFQNERGDVQYTFHAYPLDAACNPGVSEGASPLSCRAAAAAAVAGELGGADGFWRVHDWLMAHAEGFDDDALCAAVGALGFDATTFMEELDDPATMAAVADDAHIAYEIGARAKLQLTPRIFINNKPVRRWLHGERPVLRAILEAAASR